MNIIKRIFRYFFPTQERKRIDSINAGLAIIENDEILIEPETIMTLRESFRLLNNNSINWSDIESYQLSLYLTTEEFKDRLIRIIPIMFEFKFNENPRDFRSDLNNYYLLDWLTTDGDYTSLENYFKSIDAHVDELLNVMINIRDNNDISDYEYYMKLAYCSLHDLIQLYSLVLISYKKGILNEGTTISLHRR